MKKPKIKIFGAEFPDFSEEFFKALFFEKDEVWKGAKRNRIKTTAIILVGTTGVGKTTFLEKTMKFYQINYKEHGVLATYTNQIKLEDFLLHSLKCKNYFSSKWKNSPGVYVMGFDDATAVQVKPKEVRTFFSMRHVAQEITGMTEGIIVPVFLTHDWYMLSKIFRRYGQFLVVLSVPPLDVYARKHLEKVLGEEAVRVLIENYAKAMKEDKYKGIGFVKMPYVPEGYDTDVGIVRFGTVEDNSYVQIREGPSDKIIADQKDLILQVPQEDAQAESEEAALARYEKHKEANRLRQQRFRRKQTRLVEKATSRAKTDVKPIGKPETRAVPIFVTHGRQAPLDKTKVVEIVKIKEQPETNT